MVYISIMINNEIKKNVTINKKGDIMNNVSKATKLAALINFSTSSVTATVTRDGYIVITEGTDMVSPIHSDFRESDFVINIYSVAALDLKLRNIDEISDSDFI